MPSSSRFPSNRREVRDGSLAQRTSRRASFHPPSNTSRGVFGVIGLVAIVTLLAGYVPAWRAAVVNPVDVLKAG